VFAGHVGAGLAIGRAEPRVNVGLFVAAALLLDLVLWIFVLLGWESLSIPADFAQSYQPAYVFPYSHGLVASIGWSALAGAGVLAWHRRLGAGSLRVALLTAAAVFSHWLLDALVHRPELPIAGPGSGRIGLGLWEHMPMALAVEAALAVVGLALYIPHSGLPRGRRIGLVALTLVVGVFTVVGMTVAPAPPSAQAMAASSCITLVVVCGLVFWLAKQPRRPSSSERAA
jgi:hypothetical protein